MAATFKENENGCNEKDSPIQQYTGYQKREKKEREAKSIYSPIVLIYTVHIYGTSIQNTT